MIIGRNMMMTSTNISNQTRVTIFRLNSIAAQKNIFLSATNGTAKNHAIPR